MSDWLISYIRTYVPLGVFFVTGWLASNGVVVGDEAEAGLILGVSGLASAAYYAAVRTLERKWSWFGVLLGAPRQPSYPKET